MKAEHRATEPAAWGSSACVCRLQSISFAAVSPSTETKCVVMSRALELLTEKAGA
ncbi:hypothetical protein KCP70_08725 [Salmonella enterica subsp. enterica]|nr:hypothetical protein KCP70_08725 [Salmonella enterica subsp. enterica]